MTSTAISGGPVWRALTEPERALMADAVEAHADWLLFRAGQPVDAEEAAWRADTQAARMARQLALGLRLFGAVMQTPSPLDDEPTRARSTTTERNQR